MKLKQSALLILISLLFVVTLGIVLVKSHTSVHVFISFIATIVIVISFFKSLLNNPLVSHNQDDTLLCFDTTAFPFLPSRLVIYDNPHLEYPSYIYRAPDGTLQLRHRGQFLPLSSFSLIDYTDNADGDSKKYFIINLRSADASDLLLNCIPWLCLAGILFSLIFSTHLALNDKYKGKIDYFVSHFVSSAPAVPEPSENIGLTYYNPDYISDTQGRQKEIFQQCHFILVLNDSEQNGIGFAKILCINPNNYNINVINLNHRLAFNDMTLKAVLDNHQHDYAGILQSVQDMFRIRIDDVLVLHDEIMSSVFSTDCIEWTPDAERMQNPQVQKAFAEMNINVPEDIGYYSYEKTISLIRTLEARTDDIIMNHAGHAPAMESILCDLQNDLLYSVLKSIISENYDTTSSAGQVISTTLTTEEIDRLTNELRNRISSFIASFRSDGNCAMFPFSSDCMCFRDENHTVMLYTSDGFLESQMVHALYYTRFIEIER